MRVVETISARLPANLKTKDETMNKIGTKLKLHEVYCAEIGGLFYEAVVNETEIELSANGKIVSKFDSDEEFLQSKINGDTVENLISDGMMRIAEFSPIPLPD